MRTAAAMLANTHRQPAGSNGQVLPLFALFLIVLLGMAALAIDVSGALATNRFYRSAADGAALAGAQDLQQGTTRVVTDTERTRARTHALEQLESLLNASGPRACDPTTNVVDCALQGTGLLVSIKTPSPTCVDCNPNRSVQVSVNNPSYGLAFARIFGQDTWNVGATSVAGLDHGRSYTLITLRPPKKLGSTFDVKDIFIDGGSVVNIVRGDVGTNANMEYSGTNSILTLQPEYDMYYFPGDPPLGPLWGTSPPAQNLTTLIKDPGYEYPSMVGAPTPYTDARASQAGLPGVPVTRADADSACAALLATVPVEYAITQPPERVYCYEPGIYDTNESRKPTVSEGDVALLKPGAYYFMSGLTVRGRLLGGFEPGAPGVVLMFDECLSQCIFDGNNALTIALNAGTRYPATSGSGSAALAAIDWEGQAVETTGASSPTPALPLTLMVRRDTDGPGGTSACTVPTSEPWIEPSACDANQNKTINIAGGGSLVLEGVQYMPTDNVEIRGGSEGTGRVGQIIAWTVMYAGGTHINQEGPVQEGIGVLRLDAACSAPGEPCNP